MPTTLVVGAFGDGGIGKGGKLPWFPKHLQGDMGWFKYVTMHAVSIADGELLLSDSETPPTVVMGRTTWNCIPPKFRPLPNRRNVILSRTPTPGDREIESDLISFVSEIPLAGASQTMHVIGGSQVYDCYLNKSLVDLVFLTEIKSADCVACDTFFPLKVLEQFPHKTDITQLAYKALLKAGFVSASIFDEERGCFSEHGGEFTYRMFLYQRQ